MKKERKKSDKNCSICGKNYFRRNRFEAWTSQNPGKREGWEKKVAKICLACMNAAQSSSALLRLVSVRIVGSKKRKAS